MPALLIRYSVQTLFLSAAATRTDRMPDIGDLDGPAVWKRIKVAVDEQLRETPNSTIH